MSSLELHGISKRFGSVQALEGADFVLLPGEVHALLGENGAGKSTLMRIAAGMLEPDTGTISIAGRPVRLASPRDAASHGIALVHQHFSSVPAFTAAENIALGASWPLGSQRSLIRRVEDLSRRSGLAIEPEARTEDLPVIGRQRIEVLKALATGASILLFDEPTGVLAPADAAELLRFTRTEARRGASIALITHRLDEALFYADRVTVLRRGKMVFSGPVEGLTSMELAALMLGRAPESIPPRTSAPRGAVPAIRASRVTSLHSNGRGVRQVSFAVYPGEVVGIAAVEGSGQRELLRLLAGMDTPQEGALEVRTPRVFIPEDRTIEGLISEFSLTENLVLGAGTRAPWVRHGLLSIREAEAATNRVLRDNDVRSAGPRAPARSLSGGNQQRFILGRALAQHPVVLLAEQPARGLDLAASHMVYQRFREAARQGTAVLFHGNDLDELLAWCDRLLVMAGGHLVELPGSVSREEVGALMLSSTPASHGAA